MGGRREKTRRLDGNGAEAVLVDVLGGWGKRKLGMQPVKAASRSAHAISVAGGSKPSAPSASSPSTRVTRQMLARLLSATAAPPSSSLKPSQADRIEALHKGAAESTSRPASEK